MAYLNETAEWVAGVYQIEDEDPVAGGPPNEETKDGLDNIPHVQLLSRILFLKAQIDARYNNAAIDAAIAGSVTPAQLLTKLLSVDGAGSNLDADRLDGLQATAFWQSAAAPVLLQVAGYQIFPSGLILQWGATTTRTTAFPIAFPNGPLNITFGDFGSASAAGLDIWDATSFTFETDSNSYSHYFAAIGH